MTIGAQISSKRPPKLSDTDRKILKVLLERDGTLSSTNLAGKIGIPRSTVLRRRRYLEKFVMTSHYSIDLAKYGFRRVDLLIETGNGLTAKIAKQFLEFPEVISAAKTFGEYVIDLKAEIIIKDNRQILRLVEAMKATPGVKNITWTEVIEEERKKKSVPDYVVDSL